MRDDEKMFNIGKIMLFCMVCIIAFLQVCYRVQDSNLKSVHQKLENTRHEYDIAGTRFSALSSAGLLRGNVVGTNPRVEVVSFSKTVQIDNIPMAEQNEL